MHMCVCMYIDMYVYVQVYVYMQIHVYVHVYKGQMTTLSVVPQKLPILHFLRYLPGTIPTRESQ